MLKIPEEHNNVTICLNARSPRITCPHQETSIIPKSDALCSSPFLYFKTSYISISTAKRTHTEKGVNREMLPPPELVPTNRLTFKQQSAVRLFHSVEGMTLTRKFIKRSVLFVDSQPFCVPVFTTLGGLKG